MAEFNSGVATSTLRKVVQILENNHIEYRFLGSIVIAAINGQLHRNVGDLDLVIDSKGKDTLYSELSKLGYKQANGLFAFARRYMSLETLEHSTLLGVGFFYGQWLSNGSFILGGKKGIALMEPYALIPTKYTLYGTSFIGLPSQVIATGINISKSNPKRKKELILLRDKNITPFPNTYIHINILGIKSDWMYHLSMDVSYIIGKVRVALGLPFDPWR